MRFQRLGLRSYGAFGHLDLEFRGGPVLHMIVGPNEAGKSTTLRAIRDFLFGVPTRSQDVHTFESKELRVHGTLLGADGKEVPLVRRKGRKGDLLNPDGSAADTAALERLLGGVGRDYFSSMFGLTHTDLVEGGQSLLDQNGSLGAALFGAGSGAGLRAVLAELGSEASEIFRNRGQNQPLNKAIARFKESKKSITAELLRPRKWKEASESLQQTEAVVGDLRRERQALDEERQKLERLKLTIPRLSAIRDYRRDLRDLPEAPRLGPSAASERTTAQSHLHEIAERVDKLTLDRSQHQARLEQTTVPEAILGHRREIEGLGEELGAHKKAVNDGAGLRSRVEAGRMEVQQLLLGLGKKSAIDDLEQLRVTEQDQAKLRDLATQKGALEAQVAQATKALREDEERVEKLENAKADLAPARDVSGLLLQVKAAQRHGDLEKAATDLARTIATKEQELSGLVATLGRVAGSLEECCGLALPAKSAVDDYRSRFEGLAAKLEASNADERKHEDKRAEAELAIKALQAGGIVHTPAELPKMRATRDEQWSEVQTSWLEGRELAEGSKEDLADRLTKSISLADQIADSLRDDAKRTTQLLMQQTELERATGLLERQQTETQRLTQQREALQDEWGTLWEPSGVEPGPPSEMRGWLDKHADLLVEARSFEETKGQRQSVLAEIESAKAQLGAELASLGEADASAEEPLAHLIDRCADLCASASANQERQRQWEKEARDAKNRLERSRAEKPAAQAALDEWGEQWAQGVALLGLDATATVAEMEAVLGGLAQVFEKWKSVREYDVRIAHIESDAATFSAKVSGLVQACAPSLSDRAVAEAAGSLVEQLGHALQADNERKHLSSRLREIDEELQNAALQEAKYRQVIGRLVDEAGVETEAELVAVEEESDLIRSLLGKLADKEESLREFGLPRETLEAEAQDVSIDSLPGELEATRERLKELDEAIKIKMEDRARLQHEFLAMDESSSASKAAEDAEAALADIRAHAATYARLILAEHILAGEIERYRKANQGPVLERAGEMFRRMTLEGFTGLETEFNDKDEPVLVCRRKAGGTVDVAGLSDGTRDQLYLALRLASLELHAKDNEPLPLIMDDLLINFDDDRAGETLKLLAEVAESTQILFFTHHSHLLDVARGTLAADAWQEHRLAEA